MSLQWQDEPPSEAGFYFHRSDDLYEGDGNDPGYGVQWVREEAGMLYATMLYHGSLQEGPVTHEMFSGDEWAGPIPEPKDSIRAHKLNLNTRARNCLASAYADTERNPRESALTQKPFTPSGPANGESRKVLTVRELHKDLARERTALLKTWNLGKATMQNIEEALNEAGVR